MKNLMQAKSFASFAQNQLAPVTLAVMVALSSTVSAQENDEVIEEVVTYGSYSGSLVRAMDVKRNAATIVDAISAQDIGKFPTENVAEALQLVPGVQIARDRGEGLSVSVRGLGPQFQVTQLNGRNIAINENVENSGQKGREFRYDTLPSELIAGLEVVKSPSANMEEGAIGGLVNIKTFKPLDLDIGGSATVKVNHAELADSTDPSVSGLVNWKNDDESIGFLVSGVVSEREVRQDRAFIWNWIQGDLGNDDTQPELSDVFATTRSRPTLERQTRERQSLASAFQWQSSETHELNVDMLWSQFNVDFDEIGIDITPGGEVTNANVQNGVLVSGTALDSQLQLSRETSDSEHQSFTVGIENKWTADDWALTVDLSLSKADSETVDPIRRTRLRLAEQAVDFDYSAGFEQAPSFSFPVDITDSSIFPGRRIEYRTIVAEDTDNNLNVDFEYFLSGFINSVEVGANLRSREREYNRRDIRVSDGISGEFFDSSYFDAFPVSDFLADTPASYPKTFAVPNSDAFFNEFFDNGLLAEPLTNGDKRNSYVVEEDIIAGYVQANFEASGDLPYYGNFGVRVVKTEQSPSGTSIIDDTAQAVSFDNEYTEVLPSANINFQLSEDLILRSGAAKVLSRPSLPDLRPGLTFSTDAPTASGGNPLLDPYKAWQYDLSLEWYFNDTGYLSGSVFYKDITTFIAKAAQQLNVNGTDVTVSAPANTGEGEITGFELAYQQVFASLPAPFNQLGMQANYTYVDSSVTTTEDGVDVKQAITGLSENSFNIVMFYELENFAARIGYNWRDSYLVNDGVGKVADEFQDAFGTVDMTISYALSENSRLSFDAVNLTEEKVKHYFGEAQSAGRIDNYGRRYSVSFNTKF